MGISTKYLTLVLKALVFGAIIASFSLSVAHAKDRRGKQTIKALRMNLWYLGVDNNYARPEDQVFNMVPQDKEQKQRKAWPEELTRALKKSRL